MPKVKICGITDPQQARDISLAGADYIGVVLFEKSPRFIPTESLKKIKEKIPKNTKLVAVVVNPTKEECEEILKVADIVQFHGEESLEFVSQFEKDRVIKAFRIRDESDIEKIKPFMEKGYTILIDAYIQGEYGGTGHQIDLNLVRKICGAYDKVIVAGGLSEENIGYILREVKPYGVDASSKLEIRPGIKDLEKVRKFIKAAKDESAD